MAPTLLVADDSTTIQRVVDLTFSAHGIAVVTVSDGQQAVDYLASARPDAALISATLQKLDGFEVANFVRSQARLHGLPVLLMAGAFDAIDDERAKAAGAVGVLYKPLDPEHVIHRVKELIAASQRGETQVPSAGQTAGPSASPSPVGHTSATADLRVANEPLTEGRDEPTAPAAPAAAGFGAADAFAVLLAEEQGEVAPPLVPQPIVELSDNMVDRIADRVAERLMQSAFGERLRDTVHNVSERLVREEIQRIRAAAHPQGRQQ